ncbi:hypothetical protein ACFOOK_26175 [Micromonospora krabiensis]|uniref:Uncharacterized protein n=1 Tax=Micromonospora krabiensis TaxID=307121 RepID=A0A1C3N5U2_9ACTN|nr:hypothetical protein [Micromonospora krabiensis]SBV27947.1 hypothetical protein GA0070620_3478 [Micromonospora krabiensis]
MALAKKDTIGGDLPPFFRPENHAADLALIFEPLSVREGVQGKFGLRDHVKTRVTTFRTQEALDKGEPSSVEVVEINATVMAKDLKELMEEAKKSGDSAPALIATLLHYQPKNGGNKSWVFRLPRDADYDKAAAYYEQREAKMQAALADVPSF